jgi:hypothetical protein
VRQSPRRWAPTVVPSLFSIQVWVQAQPPSGRQVSQSPVQYSRAMGSRRAAIAKEDATVGGRLAVGPWRPIAALRWPVALIAAESAREGKMVDMQPNLSLREGNQ